MKEAEEILGSTWAIVGSFIFFVCGLIYCIHSYKKSRAIAIEAAEALQNKMAQIKKLQDQLRDHENRNPTINPN
jgi:hypothetical protein